ncbi:MAG: hypothetical protein IKM77_12115, partial [Prevotella sp.]|nr:hypothetical protein [Prevotella sp.]
MKRLYILLLLVLTLFGCSTNREITDRKEIHFWGKTFFYLQKYDKAISILKDAAEKDYVPAQYDLGIIYLYIRKDYAKAY